MPLRSVALVMIFLFAVLAYPALASGVGYTEYRVDNLRVVVVDARNPSYSFEYCGSNYIDYDASDDYAVVGPQGILGLTDTTKANNLSVVEVTNALRALRDYTIWHYNTLHNISAPEVIIKRDYGALEVIVKPGIDALKASKQIAEALKGLMVVRGYTTLIVVRPLSDLTPGELEKAFERISKVVMGAVFNPSSDAPQYLLKIAELQRRSLESKAPATYIQVGIGVYGSIGVVLWGPEPTEKDLVELAKWIRDKTGECTTPLYIQYAGPTPLKPLPLDGAGQATSRPARALAGTHLHQVLLVAITLLSIPLIWSLYRVWSGRKS